MKPSRACPGRRRRVVKLAFIFIVGIAAALGAQLTAAPASAHHPPPESAKGPNVTSAVSILVDFETPALGESERQVIDPYVDAATGIQFTADPLGASAGTIGLVKNRATSVCVEPPDENQKLGTTPRGSQNIGLSGFPIRAIFPSPLPAPATVSVEFQTAAELPIRLRLFDAAGKEVASVTRSALPADGTCGFPGPSRARTVVSATSGQPVASAVMDLAESTGSVVFVVDNFRVQHGEPGPANLVAYIFGEDKDTAAAFGKLVQERGFEFQAVPLQDVPRADLSQASLLMVGPDIDSRSWTAELVRILDGTGKPVVGVGTGGVGYFSQLDLALGSVESVRIREAVGPSIANLISPLLFFCDLRFELVRPELIAYRQPVTQVGLLLDPAAPVDVVGVDPQDSKVATVATERGRYMLFGYGDPDAMTDQGKGLLHGALAQAIQLGQSASAVEKFELVKRRGAQIVPVDPVLFRPDFSITNIEITQAIQCLDSNVAGCEGGDNSLPLATNRSTAVRVYLKLGGILPFTDQINDVPVRLYVKAGNGTNAQIFTMDSAGNANRNPQRTDATHSANFFLSIDGDESTIPVRMCAKVDPANDYNESDETNNIFPNSGAVEKDFEERRAIEIDALPVDYRRTDTEGAAVPNNNVVTSLGVQYLNKIWPVPDQPTGIDYSVGSALVWNKDDDGDLATGDGQHALIERMNGSWLLANLIVAIFGGDIPVNDFYYGWISASRFSGGHADMPIYPHAGGLGVVGIGDDSTGGSFQDRGTDIFAHELTHDMDVMHTNTADGCGSTDGNSDFPYASASIQEVGFDPITGRVYDPANSHDLMSYCPANTGAGEMDGWISPFTWNKIWDEFAPEGAAAASEPPAGLGQPFMLVRGTVGRDGTGELISTYVVEGADLGVRPVPGQYSVVQQDGFGQTLVSQSFELSFRQCSVPGCPLVDHAGFSLLLPYHAKTAAVLLLLGEEVLDTMTLAQEAPRVSILPFSDQEPLSKPTLVQWEDANPAPERKYGLFYWRGGAEVVPIALDLDKTEAVIDPQNLPSTGDGRLILLASGGLRTTRVQSEPFGVVDKLPAMKIVEPLDGAVFQARDAVVLSGRGDDADDGTLPPGSLQWSSDIDGVLGTGNVVALEPAASDGEGPAGAVPVRLSPGKHLITLRGIDSRRQTGETSINITVLFPPSVSLTATPDQGNAPLSVGFTATAEAPSGQIVAYRWDFDSDGVVDQVTSTNTTSHTYEEEGDFMASVAAVDNHQQTAFDSTNIAVTSSVPEVIVVPVPSSDTVLGGGQFDVNIQANNVTDLGGAQFTLLYGDALLSLVGDPQLGGDLDPDDCSVQFNTTVAGEVRIVIACIQGGYSGAPLTLATVRFQAAQVSQTATTTLAVQDEEAQDLVLSNSDFPNPSEIPAQGDSREVTILAGVCGDLTLDNIVNVLDPVTGLRGIVGAIALTSQQLFLGNVVLDQFFNIQDVILIMRHIVALAQITECGPLQPVDG